MIRRVFALLAVTLALAGCGVKTDLLTPNGRENPKGHHDPSKPPHPLGR
jgi:predicted small lipoprotein YifL